MLGFLNPPVKGTSVMHDRTMRLLQSMADAFNHADLRGFVAPFVFPCLIVVPGHRTIMRSEDDFVTFLEPLRGEMLLQGVKRIRPALGAVELPRKGRLRAWVRWSYEYEDRVQPRGYDSVYFLRVQADGSLGIEMVDFEETVVVERGLREAGAAVWT